MALYSENVIGNIISIVIKVCSLEEEVLSGGPSLNSHESCVNVSKKECLEETQPNKQKKALKEPIFVRFLLEQEKLRCKLQATSLLFSGLQTLVLW